MQIQTPADCSIKGLLLEILRKTDELLHSRYYETAIRARSTTDMLIGTVSQAALNHIGLLIIDEIQHIANNKSGKILLNTLTQLINNAGVSLCLVGTPESACFFEQEMMLARRTIGLNYPSMEFNAEFCTFCKTILEYSYVQKITFDDEAMQMWLYQHSGGNASVVVGLIHDAQEIAILENLECLDITTLNIAYEKRMKMLHNYIHPQSINASPPKKKKAEPSVPVENSVIGDNITVHQIVMNAKDSQKNILQEIKKSGFVVEEVMI